MVREEELISRSLRELNTRYLQEYHSHGHKGIFFYIGIALKLIKNRQFSTLKMLIDRRIHHTEIPNSNYAKNHYTYDDDLRVAIYTCVVGNYDTIKEPMYVNERCVDYYAITDQDLPLDSKWKKIELRKIDSIPQNLDAGTKNRWIKLHPHEIFKEYDYSIYIDGSFQIVCDLMPIIGQMTKEQWFAVHDMNKGIDDIYDYAKTVIAAKKAPADIIKKQVYFYKKEGFPRHYGIYHNAILVRKHNELKCIKVMEEWWEQLCKFSKRDQMSLNYVLWKNKIKKDEVLLLPGTAYSDPFFYYTGHNV